MFWLANSIFHKTIVMFTLVFYYIINTFCNMMESATGRIIIDWQCCNKTTLVLNYIDYALGSKIKTQ